MDLHDCMPASSHYHHGEYTLDLSLLPTSTVIAFAGLLGLCFGSFANVVIARFPRMLERQWLQQSAEALGQEPPANSQEPFNLAVPASTCPYCQHAIRWYENIPILSYLFLRGRCSQCQQSISLRYPVIEGVTGILFALVVWQFGATWQTLFYLIFVYLLLILTCIDLDTMLLPDQMTLGLLWIGLLFHSIYQVIPWQSAIYGAVAGYLFLWCVFWGFKLLTGKEGMGYGDFKLLAALGAWFGIESLPMLILLSSVVGTVVGLSLILFKKMASDRPIPFGPYLALAGILALFYQDQLQSWLLLIAGATS